MYEQQGVYRGSKVARVEEPIQKAYEAEDPLVAAQAIVARNLEEAIQGDAKALRSVLKAVHPDAQLSLPKKFQPIATDLFIKLKSACDEAKNTKQGVPVDVRKELNRVADLFTEQKPIPVEAPVRTVRVAKPAPEARKAPAESKFASDEEMAAFFEPKLIELRSRTKTLRDMKKSLETKEAEEVTLKAQKFGFLEFGKKAAQREALAALAKDIPELTRGVERLGQEKQACEAELAPYKRLQTTTEKLAEYELILKRSEAIAKEARSAPERRQDADWNFIVESAETEGRQITALKIPLLARLAEDKLSITARIRMAKETL